MVQEVEKTKDSEVRAKKEKWRQNISSLSVLAVTLFVGLPLWWKTTEVYRSPLPYSHIDTLSTQQVPPRLLYTISVLVLQENVITSSEDEMTSSLITLLQQKLSNFTVREGEAEMTISYLVQPLILETERMRRINKAVYTTTNDGALTSILQTSSSPGHYTLLVATGDETDTPRIAISASRWAVLRSVNRNDPLVVEDIVRAVDMMVGDQQRLKQRMGGRRGQQGRGGRGQQERGRSEEMTQVRVAPGYQICFTLLVTNPSQVRVNWNIEEATDMVLLPFLKHPGIARLANYTISSQVFHYTDLKLSPQRSKSGNGGYVISSSSLPPMISSVESKLGSLVSQQPSLNFLVLVTPPTHSPLLIRDLRGGGGKLTDNFLIPQWGGVALYNPHEVEEEEEVRVEEVEVKMEEVMSVFVKQLKLLLGVQSIPAVGHDLVLKYGNLGMTQWQLDQLMVSRMVESVSTATTALVSLVGLLDKVKNMIISDEIQREVESSLTQLQLCYKMAGEGELETAFSHSQQAMVSAETAFFDPTILELLYFPDDQKFAIYIPLFLPISIPILLSTVTAFRWLTSSKATSPSPPPSL